METVVERWKASNNNNNVLIGEQCKFNELRYVTASESSKADYWNIHNYLLKISKYCEGVRFETCDCSLKWHTNSVKWSWEGKGSVISPHKLLMTSGSNIWSNISLYLIHVINSISTSPRHAAITCAFLRASSLVCLGPQHEDHTSWNQHMKNLSIHTHTYNFHFVHLKSYYETAGIQSKVLARHSGTNLATAITVILAKPTNMRIEVSMILSSSGLCHCVFFGYAFSRSASWGKWGGGLLTPKPTSLYLYMPPGTLQLQQL